MTTEFNPLLGRLVTVPEPSDRAILLDIQSRMKAIEERLPPVVDCKQVTSDGIIELKSC